VLAINSSGSIEIKPIGVIHTTFTDDEVKMAWISGGVPGYVELYNEYLEGLEGVEGFSHLILLVWMHKVASGNTAVLRVRPRALARYGFPLSRLPLIGVFATDSPRRPNPIGVEVVELDHVEGNKLYVNGIDVYDGTPVLDIRPLTEEYVPKKKIRYPSWYIRLKEEASKFIGREAKI